MNQGAKASFFIPSSKDVKQKNFIGECKTRKEKIFMYNDFIFDLQLFDEDENSVAEENSAEETAEQELPEGFEGLEEYKDEILAEINEAEKPEENLQENSDGENLAGQKVPYERFKSVIDERNALKAQIDEMKRQGTTPEPVQQRQQVQPQRQEPQIPQQNFQMSPPQVTPEFVKAFKNARKNLAMQMTKLTPEKIQQLEEYGEEGDEDFERWKFAEQQAERIIFGELQQRQNLKARQEQEYLSDRAVAIQSYNDFAVKEMQESDFKEIASYATGEYFDALPANWQKVIANSYVRIEKQIANPEEVLLIQNFFTNAKAAYRNKNSQPSQKRNNPASKTKFPRAENLSGANGNGVSKITAHDLEKIIDSTDDFEKLDPKIKKLFEF